MSLIHFNTAGAGIAPTRVYDSMLRYLQSERLVGAYETEIQYAAQIEGVRVKLAQFIGAGAGHHLAFFDSGTRAWATSVNGIKHWKSGGKIWVTPYEYAGNLLVMQQLAKRHDLILEVIPVLKNGDLDLDWIEENIDDKLSLVSIVHIPSATGIVLPIKMVGALLKKGGSKALYAVDACQSVGQLPLNCQDINCDLLTAGGRKFLCGPRGTAFAYLSDAWLQRLGGHAVDLHSAKVENLHNHAVFEQAAKRLELSEMSLSSIIGLGEAVSYAEDIDHAFSKRLYHELCSWLRSRSDMLTILPGTVHSGIVSFVHKSVSADAIVNGLRVHRINTWKITGLHTPLYCPGIGVDSAVRLSVHHTNTASDIENLQRVLTAILR